MLILMPEDDPYNTLLKELLRWQGKIDQQIIALEDAQKSILMGQLEINKSQIECKRMLDKLELNMTNHLAHHEVTEKQMDDKGMWVRWAIPLGLSVINLLILLVNQYG